MRPDRLRKRTATVISPTATKVTPGRRYRAVAENEEVTVVDPPTLLGGMVLVESDDGRQWFADRFEELPGPVRV